MLFLLSSRLLAALGMEYRATVHVIPTWPVVIQACESAVTQKESPHTPQSVERTVLLLVVLPSNFATYYSASNNNLRAIPFTPSKSKTNFHYV